MPARSAADWPKFRRQAVTPIANRRLFETRRADNRDIGERHTDRKDMLEDRRQKLRQAAQLFANHDR